MVDTTTTVSTVWYDHIRPLSDTNRIFQYLSLSPLTVYSNLHSMVGYIMVCFVFFFCSVMVCCDVFVMLLIFFWMWWGYLHRSTKNRRTKNQMNDVKNSFGQVLSATSLCFKTRDCPYILYDMLFVGWREKR